MRKISHSSDEDTEINITPLIDVVFIMLIFFIVTATFVKEPGVHVNKPIAHHTDLKPKASILVAIDSNDAVWVDRKKVDIRAVRPTLERMHAENPQGTVVIQADRESKYETLVNVMDSCREAGITQVAISAAKE